MINVRILVIAILLSNAAISVAQDSLQHYLVEAMENNPGLNSAYMGFYSASQRSGQAGTLPDPTLGAGVFISPVETRVGPQQFRLSLTQMFPWFGTLQAREDQLNLQAEAAFWDFANQARLLTREVRELYYELWITWKLIGLEEENLVLLDAIEKLATTRFQSGDGRMAEILSVQLDAKNSGNTLERLEDELSTKTAQFFLMLNRESGTLYLPDTIIIDTPEVLVSDETEIHPLVRKQFARGGAAAAYSEAARKQGYPSLGIGMDYVFIGKRDDMAVPDNGKNAFMPMVTVGLPVWRKKYKSMREEALAAEKQFEMAAEAEKNALSVNLLEAEFTLQRAIDEMDVSRQQIELTERILLLTETDFANDRAEFDEILENQERLLDYRKQLIRNYGQMLKAMARYDYLTGDNPEFVIQKLNDENEN